MNDSTKCHVCKHCDSKWRDYSQLPICVHPEADTRKIWALYSLEKHCKNNVHFEQKEFE